MDTKENDRLNKLSNYKNTTREFTIILIKFGSIDEQLLV